MKIELCHRLAAALVVLGAFGCSSTTSPYPDVPTFCTAKAKATCQASAICAIDANTCQNAQIVACETDANAAIASGTRKYDSNAAGACIGAVQSAFGGGASKVTYAQFLGPGSITDLCERVFTGGAKVGATCQTDYDCAGSLICAPVMIGQSARVCANAAPVNQGDFCSSPGQECQASYCAVQDSGAAQCSALAQAGQACGAAVPCVGGQRCANAICQTAVAAGQPCTTSSDCGSDDPYCDTFAGSICTVGLTFATGAADCRGFLLGGSASAGSEGGSASAGSDGGGGASSSDGGDDAPSGD